MTEKQFPLTQKMMWLIDDDDDFSLCDEMFMHLMKKYDDTFQNFDGAHEAAVIWVWHTLGLIGNGGVSYLFAGVIDADPFLAHSCDAYKRIGADKAAEILEACRSVYPESQPSIDLELRSEIFAQISESQQKTYNNYFWQADDELEGMLAQYIRVNKECFGYTACPKRMAKILEKREKRKRPVNELLSVIDKGDLDHLQNMLVNQPDLVHKKGCFEVRDFCGQLVNTLVLPIELAIYKNSKIMLEVLIKAGASINEKCMDGHSLLTNCCRGDRVELLQLLLEQGADTELMNSMRITPLLGAAKNSHTQCVKLLLKFGANIKHQDKHGANCLHNIQDLELTEFLVAHGADVNQGDCSGSTPLHVALSNKFIDIAKFMLSSGAKYHLRNEDGETATDIAKGNGCFEAIFSILGAEQIAQVEFLSEKDAASKLQRFSRNWRKLKKLLGFK